MNEAHSQAKTRTEQEKPRAHESLKQEEVLTFSESWRCLQTHTGTSFQDCTNRRASGSYKSRDWPQDRQGVAKKSCHRVTPSWLGPRAVTSGQWSFNSVKALGIWWKPYNLPTEKYRRTCTDNILHTISGVHGPQWRCHPEKSHWYKPISTLLVFPVTVPPLSSLIFRMLWS